MSLYHKYRPKTLDEIFGHPEAVKLLEGKLKNNDIPHALLLSGPSGIGKTSIGRILRDELNCEPTMDFFEINCADVRGIDSIRDIRSQMSTYPMIAKGTRIWLLDESAKLTNDAQTAMLKILEDTDEYPWVYFILCTTDPKKLITTIRNRCTHIQLNPLPNKVIGELVEYVCKQEKVDLSDDVHKKIIEFAEGSARSALVLLDKVYLIEDEDDQLNSILPMATEATAIDIARALFPYKAKTTWQEMSKLLGAIENLRADAESIRYTVLSYASGVLKGNNPKMAPRALLVINMFRDSFTECLEAGLVAACYEIIHSKS